MKPSAEIPAFSMHALSMLGVPLSPSHALRLLEMTMAQGNLYNLSGFYETAGCSQGYSSLTGFASTVHSSRCFYPHSGEPQWARCILVSDDDEWVLLSEGRPLRAKPLVAVTTTRDGNESGNVFKIRFEYLFLVMVCC
jgi:hypothetical protein